MEATSPEAFVKLAERRYHKDAEFHATVNRTVMVLGKAVKNMGGVTPPEQLRAYRIAASVTLLLKELNGENPG